MGSNPILCTKCGLEKWSSHLAHNQEVTWFESRIRYQVSRCNRFARRPVKAEVTGSSPVGIARMFAGVV